MQEVTKIKPGASFLRLDLKEFWAYRELLYFLTLRDIKIRYKQTALGVAWAVLQPVLTTIVFSILFSTVPRFNSPSIPYPLFALSGLIVWLFVQTSITMASIAFISNTNLVTKVYFPRLILPIAAAFAGLFDLLFSLAILVGLMGYYASIPGWQIALAPLFIVLAIVITIALGTLFSALNVRFRDVKYALPFLLQVWMIASPVFYPMEIVPEKWRIFYALNPMTGILDGFRSALFGTPFNWPLIGISTASVVVVTLFSLFVFKRMEDDFADQI